jgi:hypothetical protein
MPLQAGMSTGIARPLPAAAVDLICDPTSSKRSKKFRASNDAHAPACSAVSETRFANLQRDVVSPAGLFKIH